MQVLLNLIPSDVLLGGSVSVNQSIIKPLRKFKIRYNESGNSSFEVFSTESMKCSAVSIDPRGLCEQEAGHAYEQFQVQYTISNKTNTDILTIYKQKSKGSELI